VAYWGISTHLRFPVPTFNYEELAVDVTGHATLFVNALRETWQYRYDGAGRLVTEIDWGGRTTHFERDAVGRLLVKTLPDGGTWRYAYDVSDRLVSVDAGHSDCLRTSSHRTSSTE
jgi:YD repeat-containing protein